MKVLFDTSVIVAALVADHPGHKQCLAWHDRACAGEVDFLVSAHTLAELYSALTRIPVTPRITPGAARRLIRENVEEKARIVSLGVSDYHSVLTSAAELGLAGGAIYDALIAHAAQKAGADRLLTLNPDDFQRVWPDGAKIVTTP